MSKFAKCLYCGTRFTPARSSARYCSEAHKKRAKRRREDPLVGTAGRRVRPHARPEDTTDDIRRRANFVPPWMLEGVRRDLQRSGLVVRGAQGPRTWHGARVRGRSDEHSPSAASEAYERITATRGEQRFIPLEEWPTVWIEAEQRWLRLVLKASQVVVRADEFGLATQDSPYIAGARRVLRGEGRRMPKSLAEHLDSWRRTSDYRRGVLRARRLLIEFIEEVDMSYILERTIKERTRAELAADAALRALEEIEKIREESERAAVERFIEDALSGDPSA